MTCSRRNPQNVRKYHQVFAVVDRVQFEIASYLCRREAWDIREGAAQNLLEDFISHKLDKYESSRALACGDAVSRLSPYLHFGQISPRAVMSQLDAAGAQNVSKTFWRRLVWRDLAYWQLHHWPRMPTCSIRPAYDEQQWDYNAEILHKWQRGQTGFPLVDAGLSLLVCCLKYFVWPSVFHALLMCPGRSLSPIPS